MQDIDDLLQHLITGMSVATLKEMDIRDLEILRESLSVWHEHADRIYRERRATSIEEAE